MFDRPQVFQPVDFPSSDFVLFRTPVRPPRGISVTGRAWISQTAGR